MCCQLCQSVSGPACVIEYCVQLLLYAFDVYMYIIDDHFIYTVNTVHEYASYTTYGVITESSSAYSQSILAKLHTHLPIYRIWQCQSASVVMRNVRVTCIV
jgi:hypothetical protein